MDVNAGGGAIVNVGSRPAIAGSSGAAAYAVAKAALVKLTEVLALELGRSRVRVNAIIPNIIDTPTNREWMKEAALAKAARPEDVAEVIAFESLSRTPRICVQRCTASTGTATPCGCRIRSRASASCCPMRSCTEKRFAYSLTSRVSFDNPRMCSCAMYPMCACP